MHLRVSECTVTRLLATVRFGKLNLSALTSCLDTENHYCSAEAQQLHLRCFYAFYSRSRTLLVKIKIQ
jgi:hypothetical protein